MVATTDPKPKYTQWLSRPIEYWEIPPVYEFLNEFASREFIDERELKELIKGIL